MKWFFRKPPPAPTLEEDIDALAGATADTILKTALDGGDRRLRIAAIGALPDGEGLRSLAGLSASSDAGDATPVSVRRAARARLAHLIDQGVIDFPALCTLANTRDAVFSVVTLCADRDLLPQALTSITDPTRLAHLVVDGPSSRLRQLAAEALDDTTQLKQLLAQVRNKDRSVYQILKRKCEATTLDEGIAAQPSRADPDPTRTTDALPSLTADLHAAQSTGPLPAANGDALPVSDIGPSAPSEADPQTRLRRAAAAIRQAGETARAEQRTLGQRLPNRLAPAEDSDSDAASEVNIETPASSRRSTKKNRTSAEPVPDAHTLLLKELDDSFAAIDWRAFSPEAQRRMELSEELEALIGSTEEPKVLLERIHTLQTEWQKISNGTENAAPAEAERFDRALRSALHPCREYMEAAARKPQENLLKRQSMLERLTAFETSQNWDRPDWRLLARLIREAPREWREYSPVDAHAGEAGCAEFDAIMMRLRTRLDAWYQAEGAER